MLCPLPIGFAPDAQNGQDAPETSPMISRQPHGPSRVSQPYCMTSCSQPIGEAEEDGSLFN